MSEIALESGPTEEKLDELGVRQWHIWTCEPSEFPWSYDERESCYLLEGEVVVTPENGEPVMIGVGDFVVFPQGMNCTWKVLSAVKKHYTFG